MGKPKKKQSLPNTTHELAFDMHNDFDQDFVYVSGTTVNMIARVSKKDPTRQQFFSFPDDCNGREAEPHTLMFAKRKSNELKGKLWVGLEGQGRIIKLNMPD